MKLSVCLHQGFDRLFQVVQWLLVEGAYKPVSGSCVTPLWPVAPTVITKANRQAGVKSSQHGLTNRGKDSSVSEPPFIPY